jgi:hypothetical protein
MYFPKRAAHLLMLVMMIIRPSSKRFQGPQSPNGKLVRRKSRACDGRSDRDVFGEVNDVFRMTQEWQMGGGSLGEDMMQRELMPSGPRVRTRHSLRN